MNVFVLGTGRCGSTTFIRACEHLTNVTAGHETRVREIGQARFAYPDRHIEADNRLTWFLGRLGAQYPDALYVHLRRDPGEVVESFLRRWESRSIIRAFANQIVMHPRDWPPEQRREVCRFYVDMVTANVEQFLAGRSAVTMWLHSAQQAFPGFLDRIGATGDLDAAMAEWTVRHNATPSIPAAGPDPVAPVVSRTMEAATRPAGWRHSAQALATVVRQLRGR
jgi:hypothetical protein